MKTSLLLSLLEKHAALNSSVVLEKSSTLQKNPVSVLVYVIKDTKELLWTAANRLQMDRLLKICDDYLEDTLVHTFVILITNNPWKASADQGLSSSPWMSFLTC